MTPAQRLKLFQDAIKQRTAAASPPKGNVFDASRWGAKPSPWAPKTAAATSSSSSTAAAVAAARPSLSTPTSEQRAAVAAHVQNMAAAAARKPMAVTAASRNRAVTAGRAGFARKRSPAEYHVSPVTTAPPPPGVKSTIDAAPPREIDVTPSAPVNEMPTYDGFHGFSPSFAGPQEEFGDLESDLGLAD